MATKQPAPNKKNFSPSRHFNFDLDDIRETMSKLFQAKKYAAVHFLGSENLHCLAQGKEQAQASG